MTKDIFKKIEPLQVDADSLKELEQALLSLMPTTFKIAKEARSLDMNNWLADHFKVQGVVSCWDKVRQTVGKCQIGSALIPYIAIGCFGNNFRYTPPHGFCFGEFSDGFGRFKVSVTNESRELIDRVSCPGCPVKVQDVLEAVDFVGTQAYKFVSEEQREKFSNDIATVKAFMAHLKASNTPSIACTHNTPRRTFRATSESTPT